VGYAMGAGTAVAWLAAGETFVGPALEVGLPLTLGCQIGHVEHTGCHQLCNCNIT
jgi:hypothetical protein